MGEYIEGRKKTNLAEASSKQSGIQRGYWKGFLESARVTDLGAACKYFAKADGAENARYRPSRLDPFWDDDMEEFCLKPKDKAQTLGKFFKGEMAMEKDGMVLAEVQARRDMKELLSEGISELCSPKTKGEVATAIRDLPKN